MEKPVNYKILKIPKFYYSLIGPTPSTWKHNVERKKEELKLEEKIFDLLKNVGEPFGWTTQQRGKLVHDIIADTNKVDSQSQVGSNCDIELTLHTEDGFAVNRPNYIAIACIRNEEKVPTIISDIDDIDIYQIPFYKTLFEEKLDILPDDTHLDSDHLYKGTGRSDILKPIINKNITTLKYIENQLQLTYDPAYTETIVNQRFLSAYTKLTELLESHSKEIVLEPGDLLIINNLKIVHGRRKYNSLNTAQKRWLKRILLKI